METEVPICVEGVQEDPAHLYISYPVTAALSVEAVHERLIWFEVAAEAERPVGTDGVAVSVKVGVTFELELTVSVQVSPLDEVQPDHEVVKPELGEAVRV